MLVLAIVLGVLVTIFSFWNVIALFFLSKWLLTLVAVILGAFLVISSVLLVRMFRMQKNKALPAKTEK